jgi:hypothetical protein
VWSIPAKATPNAVRPTAADNDIRVASSEKIPSMPRSTPAAYCINVSPPVARVSPAAPAATRRFQTDPAARLRKNKAADAAKKATAVFGFIDSSPGPRLFNPSKSKTHPINTKPETPRPNAAQNPGTQPDRQTARDT